MSSKPRSARCFSILGPIRSCRLEVVRSPSYKYPLLTIASPTILESRPMCTRKKGLNSKGYADPLALRRIFSPLRLRTRSRRRQGAISDAEIPRLRVQLLKDEPTFPTRQSRQQHPAISASHMPCPGRASKGGNAETIIDDLSMPRPSLLGAWPHSHPEAPQTWKWQTKAQQTPKEPPRAAQ